MKRMIVSMVLAIAATATLAAPNLPLVRAASAAESEEAKVLLHVDGVTCASCSVTVRVTLERLDGVKDAVVSVEEKRASVTYDPGDAEPGGQGCGRGRLQGPRGVRARGLSDARDEGHR